MNDIIEYASDIVELSMKAEYETNTIMNGLAIATAAMLVDTVIVDAEYEIDDVALHVAVEKYVESLHKAVMFAKTQVKANGLEYV